MRSAAQPHGAELPRQSAGLDQRALGRYLSSYAEPEARRLAVWLDDEAGRAQLAAFRRALVVPLSGEQWHLLDAFRPALVAAAPSLLILVVNAHEHSTQQTHAANGELLDELERRSEPWVRVPGVAGLGFGHFADGAVLVVERCSAERLLPRAAAVGLARKLGNDLALALVERGIVQQPWLHQSDADALPPLDLLTRPLDADWGAFVFPFRHVADPDAPSDPRLLLHTLKYEASLRYHVLQLSEQRSPYTFHALGSCLTVHANSYVQVRGFPKRAAGEDFYLLQKIAKLAPVRQLEGDPVLIRARHSDRTPFGTGSAVARLATTGVLECNAPASYALLGAWLRRIEQFARHREPALLRLEGSALGGVGPRADESALGAVLQQLGTESQLSSLAQQAPRDDDLLRRCHVWFDGLKALRVLHALRAVHPPLSVSDALEQSYDVCGVPTSDEPEQWQQTCERLAELEAARLRSHEPTLARPRV